MKNTVLTFDKEELDEFIVSDYFSKNFRLYEIKANLSDYLDIRKVTDNDKLENISYSLYGTTDYWDILLLINEKNPLFDMPYDYDTVVDSATDFANKYIYYVYSQAPLVIGDAATEFTERIIAEFVEDNENNRYMYIVKATKIGEFLKVINDAGYL